MSDEGDRTCPLCAEEMDLTDQQLKPCKCGYEICVWCWHHIMEMAEKDETEGRCPACRTPYNKEKIVGTASKCERLVAEMNTEKRLKSQKAKSKTSEGRKQLSSVRVIQRNLVYIVGLPLNLADEDLLQRKEYFGQYGKVMKVSISRTAAGSIQHFANNTCSVYITYSKEEEAVRCIQTVHGFVLEGRALRACFGTTKYCHAWLRNVPCSNPDCLYLHEIGSQEDSFTKDEIISAYTRSRVQQSTGATNNMQRRSGNVLPPPADDNCNNSSASLGKPISRSTTNNPASITRISLPNSSSGRSAALPLAASWGMRSSNNQAPPPSLACLNGPSKQKPDSCNGTLSFSTAVASPTEVSMDCGDGGKKLVSKEENRTSQSKCKFEQLEHGKDYKSCDHLAVSEVIVTSGHPSASVIHHYSPPASKDVDKFNSKPPNAMCTDLPEQSVDSGLEDDHNIATDGEIQDLCSDMSSMSIFKDQGLRKGDCKKSVETLTSTVLLKTTAYSNDTSLTSEQSDLRSDLQSQLIQALVDDAEDGTLPFDDQQLKEPKLNAQADCIDNLSDSFNLPTSCDNYSSQHSESYSSLGINLDPHFVDNNDKDRLLHMSSTAILSNGYHENLVNSSADMSHIHKFSNLLPHEDKMKHEGKFEDEVARINPEAGDMRESSIISNILSMDFDPWDESLTSPQNLARLLGESETNRQQGSLKVSSSWKAQKSSQSRFSFAREEESANQVSDVECLNIFGQAVKNRPFIQDFVDNGDLYFDKFGNCNGLSSAIARDSNNFAVSSPIHANKLAVSRSQIAAPPGFSVPNRAPPPGFSSHDRMDQTFENFTGNHMVDNSTLLRNPYQSLPSGNMGSAADIEFMDPAILAVGKGRLAAGLTSPGLDMRANFSPQLSMFENDARLQLLMQRSLSPHQSQRFSETGDRFSPLSDAYGFPSRIMEQTLANDLSPFSQVSLPQSRNGLISNGRWDGWNEVQSGNDLAMSEFLRNERMGFNKFYTAYEEPKFRMPSSGDFYNRTFGI